MPDFTSALYLGFEHASSSLPPWRQFTLGKPSALESLPGTADVERQIASLVGCEQVLLAPSTLHLFWDLLQWLGRTGAEVLLAPGSYPIAHWGAQHASFMGVPVRPLSTRDLHGPAYGAAARPIVVSDGYLPLQGAVAPLREYLHFARARGGLLIIDDTQCLGITGVGATSRKYGTGGGGSLRAHGLPADSVLIVGSFAKGFGVPVAMIGGPTMLVNRFVQASDSRVHCSPPSAPVIAAAKNALDINLRIGDALRSRLRGLVEYFRHSILGLGLVVNRSLFPVQPVALPPGVLVKEVHRELLQRGIKAVLGHQTGGEPALIFILNVRHRRDEVDFALRHLGAVLRRRFKTASVMPPLLRRQDASVFTTT